MRDILFSGKRTDNGEWVIGDSLIHSMYKKGDVCVGVVEGLGIYSVIPETVSQYTGLNDKNGNKIFEGDVVKANYNEIFVVKYGRYDVMCCGCCYDSHDCVGFYLEDKTGYIEREENVWSDVKIIGNIHDNPELLGGEQG